MMFRRRKRTGNIIDCHFGRLSGLSIHYKDAKIKSVCPIYTLQKGRRDLLPYAVFQLLFLAFI